MIRFIAWWRANRRLRRIADLEYALGLTDRGWWSLVRCKSYTLAMEFTGSYWYNMPDTERQFRKAIDS